ncbi:MAG: sugar-transfer associated ATP-grasp domain-containing protein, partial [Dongiaceae bacterium]
QFIADSGNHPLFCKPVDGINSIGAIRIEGASGDALIVNGGQSKRADDVVAFMIALGSDGYLLQRVLEPTPAFRAISGMAVASIRFLALLTDNGPLIESAVVKLPTRDQVADNFWRSGNMLGAIDLTSGKLSRIVSGVGADLKLFDADHETGLPLAGASVPDFEAAKTLCLKAAVNFPGIRTQSWDVALTADGPVLLEMNFGGDLNLHQLAHNRGSLSDAYCRHLRACGYKRRLPAIVQ